MSTLSETKCHEVKIIYGSAWPQEPVEVGMNVTVTCNAGYQLSVGSRSILNCTEMGEYDAAMPECIGKMTWEL